MSEPDEEDLNLLGADNFAIPYLGPLSPPGEGLYQETGIRSQEINISMMTQRRSSLENQVAGSGLTSLIHSTAVVQQSSVIRPTPLSKIETQTNLNLPPTNWLKDNPSSKGENHPYCQAKRSYKKLV